MSDSPRRFHGLPFLIVFFAGFAFLAFRGLTSPDGGGWPTYGPLLGGGLMALFVAWIVVRERKDRAQSGDEPPPN